MPCERSRFDTLPSMHEYQQSNAMDELFRNTNPQSTPIKRNNVEFIHMITPNTDMSILKKSKLHPHQRVSFTAARIEQMSSISKETEENLFDFDKTLQVPSEYHMTSERLNINTHYFIHEHQQSNTIEESFLDTITRSSPTNTDMDSQVHSISQVQNTSDQNFESSSTQNQESSSTAFKELELNISIEHNIFDLIPWLEKT